MHFKNRYWRLVLQRLDLPRLTWLGSTEQQRDPQVDTIYHQMMARLQRTMLLLLMILSLPLAILFGVQIYRNVWIAHSIPATAFAVHIVNVVSALSLATLFVRRQKVVAAWISVLGLSLGTIFVQIWLLHEPGLLIFAVFSMAGPAIVMPLRINILLLSGIVAVFYLIMWSVLSITADPNGIVGFFVALILGFVCIGVVIRRFVAQSARLAVEHEHAAAQRGKVEQRILDLHQQFDRVASLEHDLRQPLRSIQGYLMTLADEEQGSDKEELIHPALAASQRADRLINNLLDQAGAEVDRYHNLRQPVDIESLLTSIERVVLGLARFYTDPPIPVCFELVRPLPHEYVDREQLERALLNLIDNALAYSSLDSAIIVRAEVDDAALCITVEDDGPGLPDQVKATLTDGVQSHAGLGLGLSQVQRMVQAHGGRLITYSSSQGTTIGLVLPFDNYGYA